MDYTGMDDKPRIRRLLVPRCWVCKSPRFVVRSMTAGPDTGWMGHGDTPSEAYTAWALQRANELVAWARLTERLARCRGFLD